MSTGLKIGFRYNESMELVIYNMETGDSILEIATDEIRLYVPLTTVGA